MTMSALQLAIGAVYVPFLWPALNAHAKPGCHKACASGTNYNVDNLICGKTGYKSGEDQHCE